MAEFKIVISDPKTGKSYQREVKDDSARPFLGKKIGTVVKGEAIDLTGYEFEIKGGSDYCGFPMRKDLPGTVRKKILSIGGTGLRKKRKGQRQRKMVCGNQIHPQIAQINLKIIKHGKAPLGEEKAEAKPEGEAKPAEKKEAAPKEEKQAEEKKEKAPKEEPKAEEKPKEEKKEEKTPKEKPKEEKAEEPKKE